jgi:hypothetical protein
MNDDNHLGDDKDQYDNWDRTDLLRFLKVHGCRRLDRLSAIEKQRHIALPATSEQQKFLLQLACELKDEPDSCLTLPTNTEEWNVAEAQDAFNKLEPIDRSKLRDATKTLFSLNNAMAERYSDHKQSALRNKDQNQEHAQADQPEAEDS